jgi:hypothetical protein
MIKCTLFVVADEAQLTESVLEFTESRDIVSDLNLTGFVDNQNLEGDLFGEFMYTWARKHAQGAENDFAIFKVGLVRCYMEYVGTDDVLLDFEI